jgi:hypothetical protein
MDQLQAFMRGLTFEEWVAMRYHVSNAKGEVIARYDNESEVKTFLDQSLPPDATKEPDDQGNGERIYFDKEGEEAFRVRDTKFNRA